MCVCCYTVAWHVCFSFLFCLFFFFLCSYSFALFCFIVCENMMNHCRNYRPYIIQANKNYVALFDCDVRNLTRLLSFIVEMWERERGKEWERCVCWRSTRLISLNLSIEWAHELWVRAWCAFHHSNIYFVKDFCVLLPVVCLCVIFNLNLNKNRFWGPVSLHRTEKIKPDAFENLKLKKKNSKNSHLKECSMRHVFTSRQ